MPVLILAVAVAGIDTIAVGNSDFAYTSAANEFGSVCAYAANTDHAAQCLCRSAIAMMTKLFADQLAEHGINVYEIRAGIISSVAGDAAHAKFQQRIQDGLVPICRWGRPEDIGRAVAAIAEGLLDFSTGEVINVDGGFHLPRF